MDGQRVGFVMPKKRPVERVIPRARDLALRPKMAAVPPSEQVVAKLGKADLVAGIDIEAHHPPLLTRRIEQPCRMEGLSERERR